MRRGDWIGVVGYPGRTNPKKGGEGELSIFAREVVLLSPCLRQLPTEYYGFKDQEQRHRQRFLDLVMNDATRETFITRTAIVKYVRKYFDDRDFLEVQTPMMNKVIPIRSCDLGLRLLTRSDCGWSYGPAVQDIPQRTRHGIIPAYCARTIP